MRRINFVYGLKQRINEFLGRTPVAADPTGDLTAWSLQAAMIKNLQRVVSSLVGEAPTGRVMKGLNLSGTGTKVIRIAPGFGFTSNGDIVSVAVNYDVTADNTPSAVNVPVYLKHELAILEEGAISNPGGKSSNLIGRAGNVEIVADDKAAALGVTITEAAGLVIFETPPVGEADDYIYLGEYSNNISGDIVSITDSEYRGLPANIPGSSNTVFPSGVNTSGTSNIADLISSGTIDAQSIIVRYGINVIDYPLTIADDTQIILPAGTNKVKIDGGYGETFNSAVSTINVKNGIIIGHT